MSIGISHHHHEDVVGGGGEGRMSKCGICNHEKRAAIDAVLSGDHVLAQAARQFDVKESPLRRHRDQGHHKTGEASAAPPPSATTASEVVAAERRSEEGPASVPAGLDAADQAEPSPLPLSGPLSAIAAPLSAPPISELPPSAPAPSSRLSAGPLPDLPDPSHVPGNNLDAALARAMLRVQAVRRTEAVAALDGRRYKTARTTDIVKMARAALLAEGLTFKQVRQTLKIVGRTPVVVLLYELSYVLVSPREGQDIEIEMPIPTDKTQDVHFRVAGAATYALRNALKRLLLIEETDDDEPDLKPAIPDASEPDPWGLQPDRQPTEAELEEYERRLREAPRQNVEISPTAAKTLEDARRSARAREFQKRAVERKARAAGAPASSPGGSEDLPDFLEEEASKRGGA